VSIANHLDRVSPMKKTRTLYLARVLTVLCSCLMSLPVLAQNKGGGKGGGGGGADGGGSTGPAGDVYFQPIDVWSGTYYELSKIKADGSGGAIVVYDNPDGQGFLEASHHLHGGQRWFLSLGNWWPGTDWGSNNISATSESGVTVPLFVSSDFTFIEGEPHWVRPANDNWVSFAGTQWETDPVTGQQTLVDEGIFRVQVQFAENGTIVGGVPGSLELVISTLPFDAQPYGHDWGADGQLLFVTRVQYPDFSSSTQLWMADVSDPNDPLILPVSTGSNQPISSPSWSPDGSKVAFNEGSTGIVILTLSNGSRKTIRDNATTGVGRPQWSPTGEWIVYHRTRSQDRITKVIRANADGTGQTYLADGWVLGWR
jgi:hypothetical protein